MDKKDRFSIHDPRWLKDFQPGEETVQRFTPEQMVECSTCTRINPPTRLSCVYCGAQLEISEKNQNLVRPNLRKLENWEKGFNVVCLPQDASAINESALKETAAYLRLEQGDLERILTVDAPLPVIRTETAAEAELVKKRLVEKGFSIHIVSDAELEADKLPQRIRAAELGENLILRFAVTEETIRYNWRDLRLLVTGVIVENRREASERRKGGQASELEASEFSVDEKLLDLYFKDDSIGYRISANSFDFSSLGERKSLLANENFQILLEEIIKHAPEAAVDDKYRKIRPVLSIVWSVDERKESTGWQHQGVGKISLGSRTTISNLNQFTRYSRLAAHIQTNRA